MSFRFALAVERIHHELYTEALQALETVKDLPDRKVYVCPVCGNTVYDAAPDKCPVCNAPGSSFEARSSSAVVTVKLTWRSSPAGTGKARTS